MHRRLGLALAAPALPLVLLAVTVVWLTRRGELHCLVLDGPV